ncbi:GNAT family N-acetyltransferase [Solimicrobium silvestre]|uniref:Sortase and related acyltransferase n=1 Tax=Solimicrobium silvestre TaxID=2099400 RepID=A0A2S9GUD2_9BURK|nr:GNAT family N-acetyltransferase [Solimicrobium silvestre]PRC91313.1 Sortase and related acyltransferase [Solimicrobium silvestre]
MPLHRIAVQQDLADIVAIYNSTVASRQVTADVEEVSVASRQAWFDEHSPEKRPLWVLELDHGQGKQILGWLSFSNFYGRAAYAGTAELSIYLHPDARGKGWGTYCLKLAEAHAPLVGVHTLLGFIFGHNTPSLRLFEKFGFQKWAELPKVANLDGIERDLIILGKRVA